MSKRPQLILCSAESASASGQLAQEVLVDAVGVDRPVYLLRLAAGSAELWRVPWWALLRLAADELGGWPGGNVPAHPPDPRIVPWLPGLDEVLAALLASHLIDGAASDPSGDEAGDDALVVVDCGSELLRWLLWLAEAERALQAALDESMRTGRAGPLPTGMTLEAGNPSPAQLFVQMLRQARRDLGTAKLLHRGDQVDAFLIELLCACQQGSSVTSTPQSLIWQLPAPHGLPEGSSLEVGATADRRVGLTRVVVCAGTQCITIDPPAALRRARLVEATLIDGLTPGGATLQLHFTPDPQAW